jgi:trimeric autotransporter adhesin
VCGGGNNVAQGNSSFAAGDEAQALHTGAFVWGDDSTGVAIASTNNNSVTFRAAGGFQICTSNLGRLGAGLFVPPGGSSWTSISDRNAKKDFAPVNCENVLEKLSRVPIQQWHYKWKSSGDTLNMGPMAQDFKGAFYPGRDDKGISTLEFDGVELAAIQGLNQKVDELKKELDRRDAENAQLERQNDTLADRLNQLEVTVNRLSAQK